jgi:molybdopterin converting factor small subunit
MKVLFFAQIRDFTGRGECDVPVSKAVAAEELWSALDRLFPGITKFRSSTRLARNSNFAGDGDLFHTDDEVALLPPVSGG